MCLPPHYSFCLTSSFISSRPCVMEDVGQVRGRLGVCGPHPSWPAKERVSTALRPPQRVQRMTIRGCEVQILLSPATASDCPLRLGVLHLCSESFAFDRGSIWHGTASPPPAPFLGISEGAHWLAKLLLTWPCSGVRKQS